MAAPIFYITSPGYSGSTLLTYLLASHPQVATIGEQFYLCQQLSGADPNPGACSCGKPFQQCSFLQEAYQLGKETLPFWLRDTDYPAYRLHSNRFVHRVCRSLVNRHALNRIPFSPWPCTRLTEYICATNRAVVDYVLNRGDVRNPESWRTQLTAEQLAIFESVAGALNRELGYD